jgi:NTP pyrophosphatase (non-canonical NTP hydrolase)
MKTNQTVRNQVKAAQKRVTRTFQPWDENEQRLSMASRLGINVSELINETLRGKLDEILNQKTKQLQKELAGMTTTLTR